MSRDDLIRRLRERAATSRRNARTYEASGYAGEAFAHYQRALAYDLAAEDATLLDDLSTVRRAV